MTNQIDKAFNESAEKSAFVCVSCGQNNIIKTEKSDVKATSQVHDRFTDAVTESSEKSAFVCESCRQAQSSS
jgi:predicted RNA-binding Zn-ribbon protein involved in translation (DUF1610 family)